MLEKNFFILVLNLTVFMSYHNDKHSKPSTMNRNKCPVLKIYTIIAEILKILKIPKIVIFG